MSEETATVEGAATDANNAAANAAAVSLVGALASATDDTPDIAAARARAEEPRNAVLAQIAKRAHDAVAADMQPFDEDTGVVLPRPGETAAASETTGDADPPRDEQGRFAKTPAEPQEGVTTSAEADSPRKVKIKVYGEEREIEESELIAGYQISAAARRQLEAANAAKRQYEAALARIGQTVQPANQNQMGQAEAPAAQQAPQGRSPAIPAELISALVRHEVTTNEAVSAFKREFSDIANDPVLYREAIAREDQRLWRVQQGVEPDRPLAEALKEHGNAIRSWVKRVATPAPQDQSKLKAKASAPAPVVGSAIRAPAPESDKPKSQAEIIAEMRKARGFKTG